MCVICMASIQRGKKSVSDLLKPEFQAVVSHPCVLGIEPGISGNAVSSAEASLLIPHLNSFKVMLLAV